MSEITDAVVVIVSEETGAITVAVGGMLKRHLTTQALERILRSELCPEKESADDNQMWVQLKQKMQAKKKEESKNDEE
jgi:diadenylate cyclase